MSDIGTPPYHSGSTRRLSLFGRGEGRFARFFWSHGAWRQTLTKSSPESANLVISILKQSPVIRKVAQNYELKAPIQPNFRTPTAAKSSPMELAPCRPIQSDNPGRERGQMLFMRALVNVSLPYDDQLETEATLIIVNQLMGYYAMELIYWRCSN